MGGIVNTASEFTRYTGAGAEAQVFSGDGICDAVVFPTALAAAVTLYDGLTATNEIVVFPIGYPAGVHPLGAYCTAGLRINRAGTDEVTVLFRGPLRA